jgi:hypothetical protein
MKDWIHDPSTQTRIRKSIIAAYTSVPGNPRSTSSRVWVQGHTEIITLGLTVDQLDRLLDISTDDE